DNVGLTLQSSSRSVQVQCSARLSILRVSCANAVAGAGTGRMQPANRGRDIRRLIAAPLLPGAFLLGAVVLATYSDGAVAGYLSAAAGLAVPPLLLSEPALVFMPDRPSRLMAVAVLALIIPVLTVHLRGRIARRLENERTMRERAEAANR